MQGTAFKTNFLDLIKDLLKKQISEFKVTINDWRKMERDSKELLDNYEKVRTLLKKIKNIIICFVLQFKVAYLKSSRESEEIQIIEKCASLCKDLTSEKLTKINTRFLFFRCFLINLDRSLILMKEQIEIEKKYKYTGALFNNNFEGYQKDIVIFMIKIKI